jgi:hypothetical protein
MKMWSAAGTHQWIQHLVSLWHLSKPWKKVEENRNSKEVTVTFVFDKIHIKNNIEWKQDKLIAL